VTTAQHIDASGFEGELVIVAGRNAALRAQLEAQPWQHKTHIYGFVENMPVLMRGADILISKAGPATITEAAAIGIPMILNGAIQHQESVNADYVVAQGAGLYVTDPRRVAEALTGLMRDEGRLAALARSVQQLAQPDAIWRIADEVWAFCG
jgi:1,2-diacylglycerol 3-beta-galactosyltransferase